MADIHIHRDHKLGLAGARKAAWKWAEAAEQKFGMDCTVIEGEASDVVEFTRPGVDGSLVVSADAFELTARLGFLIGAFRHRIESEIEENLDALLAGSAKKPAAKTAKAANSGAKKK
ncbi:MAG: polyhydroxyalkanoic acid system family protein [Caldimonas sp.]